MPTVADKLKTALEVLQAGLKILKAGLIVALKFTQRTILAPIIVKFRHHFGMDLPERNIALNFPPMPGRKQNKRKPELSISELHKIYRPINADPTEVMQQIKHDLTQLNAYPVGTKRRLTLSHFYWQRCYFLCQQLIKSYAASAQLGDAADRATLLDGTFALLDQVRRSYQIVFVHDYELPNWRYAANHSRINEIAFLIIEVIQMQQRIGALRYRRLPASAWQTANKVFRVMQIYENVTEQHETSTKLQQSSLQQTDSLQEAYLRLQMLAYFDLSHLACQQHPMLISYLRNKSDLLSLQTLSLKTPQNVPSDADDYLWIDCEQSTPAKTKHALTTHSLAKGEPDAPQTGLLIKLDELKAQIRGMQKRLQLNQKNTDDASPGPQVISNMAAKNRLAFFSALSESLNRHERPATNFSSGEVINLTIYGSFKRCYDSKMNDKRSVTGRRQQPKPNKDSILNRPLPSETESAWRCLFRDDRRMVLQTLESQNAEPITLGALIAYAIDDPKSRCHQFATVTRFERIGQGQINIETCLLTEHAEAVMFIDPQTLEQDPKARFQPALLTQQNDQWQLFIHNISFAKKIHHIELTRGDQQTYALKLGACVHSTCEHSLFKLQGDELANMEALFYAPDTQDEDNEEENTDKQVKKTG
ncbi:MAG: hypothetical protein COA42_11090 [Alteromonadaceae bacterium]|nr:MAG: hypothetical protein COA42_11090 [Alteromonadaceae bacterium]